MNFFEIPYVAGVLGTLFGFILIGAYGYVATAFTGERARLGLTVSMALCAIEMVIAFVILLLYRTYAKEGFLWFGIFTAVGFCAGFVYLILKLVRKKV